MSSSRAYAPAVLACVRAMGYVTVRRWLRRLRGIAGKPWALLGLAIGVALLAGAQILALRQAPTGQQLDRDLVDLITSLVPLVLPLLLLSATLRSLLRLDVADVSWLLTAPAGARAVFAWKVLLRPIQYGLTGVVAGLVSRLWLGLPPTQAWKVAAAAAVAGLLVRVVSYGGHLLAIRAGMRIPLRVAAGAWAAALITGALLDFPGAWWVQIRPVTQRLVTAVLDPGAAHGGELVILLAAALVVAAVLVGQARGFQESAEAAARQDAHAQETMRRDRSGLEAGTNYFRTGLRSLPGAPVFAGERALCYRGVAQQRRMLRMYGLELTVELALTVILLVLWPRFAWAPAGYLLMSYIVSSPMQGLGAELDHNHLRLAPLRPLRALLWVNAVPVAVMTISLEVLWLPLVAAGAVRPLVGGLGAALIPCVAMVLAAAGSLAATASGGMLTRIALALALGITGAVPALALVVPALLWQATPLLVLAAGVLLATLSGAWLVLTRRRVWGG